MSTDISKNTPAQKEELKKEFSQSEDYFVLHVDDEREIQDIFREDLKTLGVKVLSASSSQEALSFVQKHGNKIIFIASDIKMPEMDGFQLRDELLQTHPQIPFAIISSYVDKDMALRGVELKIVAFLGKPLDYNSLVDVLHREALPRFKEMKEEDELRQSFISDGEGFIEEAEDLLLKLEQDSSDPEFLNRLFAIMHTLKGASAFFEPKDLHLYVHEYENILKRLQRAEVQFSPGVFAALFKGFDGVKSLFSDFRTGAAARADLSELLQLLEIKESAESHPQREPSPQEPTAGTIERSGQKSSSDLPSKGNGSEDIKVSVKLLDEFMQLSGEVTVIRNMLNKCVSSIEKRFAGDRDVGMLTELLSELHKINSGVQNKMTEIRKVSLKTVVRPIPRAVRDVAKSLKKKVDLQIKGDDLRVDTSIADVLNSSLLHIIKNSIDHGLETPSERLKSGKNETGQITLEAHSRDEKVIVKISDDGKGLSKEAIRSKLLKNGLHTSGQVEAMSDAELYAMIFSSGFSTAQQVTEISGRGVGMSMVKDCVEAIGGQIIIQSEPGKGAMFQLELPVPKSVLIASCLAVRVGQRRFSLVQDDILRVFQIPCSAARDFIRPVADAEFLIFENDLVPIVNLNELLKLNQTHLKSEDCRRLILMQNAQDNRRMAIEVSEILDVEDMVIKNLHATLNSNSLYRGVTFLDDGGVGLILSTTGLLSALNITATEQKASQAISKATEAELAQHRIKQALTVRLAHYGAVALPQDAIFRIEEVDLSELKHSGSSQVMPYRNSVIKVMRLIDLMDDGSPLEKGTRSTDVGSGKIPMVVVRQNNNFVGLEVDQVLDMVNYSDLKTELAQEENGILGHMFLDDKTVALLSLEKLLENLQMKHSQASTHAQRELVGRDAA